MQALIFLNGEITKLRIIRKFLKQKSYIIAADGGANFLKRHIIIPDIIIGDLDSINKSTLNFFKNKKVQIKKITEQETTDFEKCLRFCLTKKFKKIFVFGATSSRPDHTLNNFSVLKRYHKKVEIKLITNDFEIFFIDKKTEFDCKINELVSFLALPDAKKVKTTGLKYRLLNEDLEFGVREGTLNRAISKKATISFAAGSIILFKKISQDK